MTYYLLLFTTSRGSTASLTVRENLVDLTERAQRAVGSHSFLCVPLPRAPIRRAA